MFAPVPAAPPARGAAAAAASRSRSSPSTARACRRRQLLARRLVDVEVGLDLHARLAGAERLREQRVEAGLELALVARLRRPACWSRPRRPRRRAPSPCGHSSCPAPSVIVTFSVFRPLTDEATSCAMPRTAPGSSASDAPASMTAAVAGRRLVGEQRVLGQHELDLGAGDAVDLLDRPGDLALQRALVGDLLLEVGRAELLLVEQLEALLRAARRRGTPALGQRDPRLGDGGLLDGDRGAVRAQLVADALLVERGGDLAGVGRVERGDERRVRRRGREPQHEEEHEHDDGQRAERRARSSSASAAS